MVVHRKSLCRNISVTVSPQPKSFASVLNPASVYPARGLKTMSLGSIFAIPFSVIFRARPYLCLHGFFDEFFGKFVKRGFRLYIRKTQQRLPNGKALLPQGFRRPCPQNRRPRFPSAFLRLLQTPNFVRNLSALP